MIYWLYQQFKAIREALAGRDRPEELAWAVALGTLVGVVPKGNLVAVALVCIVFALRINHAMAAVTAVAVSFAAMLFDPFTHGIGQWILEQPSLQTFFAWSWKQPLLPWTDLNNTVVMGSLVMGLITLLPIYNFTLPIFKSMVDEEEEADSVAAEPRPDAQALLKREEVRTAAAEHTSTTVETSTQIDVIRIRRPDQPTVEQEIVSETTTKQENVA